MSKYGKCSHFYSTFMSHASILFMGGYKLPHWDCIQYRFDMTWLSLNFMRKKEPKRTEFPLI